MSPMGLIKFTILSAIQTHPLQQNVNLCLIWLASFNYECSTVFINCCLMICRDILVTVSSVEAVILDRLHTDWNILFPSTIFIRGYISKIMPTKTIRRLFLNRSESSQASVKRKCFRSLTISYTVSRHAYGWW